MADDKQNIVKPITEIGTAHRLEDGRVLVTPADHAAHAREIEMEQLEDAALAQAKAAVTSTQSTGHEEGQSDG